MISILLESVGATGLIFLALSAPPLTGALMLTRLFRSRANAAQRASLLRASLIAALAALLLSCVPLPRPNVTIPFAPTGAVTGGVGPAPVRGEPSADAPAFPLTHKATPAPKNRVADLYRAFAIMWLIGTILLVLRLFAGLVSARRLRGGAAFPPDSVAASLCRETFRDSRQTPRLVAGSGEDVFLIGLPLSPPFLVLPLNVETRFAPIDLQAILAHERAHLEREDCHWNLLAQLLCAALWFQPLLYLVTRAMERESEAACDEIAVAAALPRRAYADLLLRVAASRLPTAASLRVGVAPLLTASRLEERIRTLMTHPTAPAPPRLRAAAVAALLFLTAFGALAFGPKIIAAPSQPPAPPVNPLERPINLDVADTPASQAVEMALAKVGLRLAPEDMKKYVSEDPIRSLRMTEQPVPNALRLIFRATGKPSPAAGSWVRYEVKRDTVHMRVIALAPSGLPTARVTVTYGPGTLSGALRAIFDGMNVSVAVTDDPNLTTPLSVKNAPANEVIDRLMRRFPSMTLSVSDEGVMVQPARTIAEEAQAARERVEAETQRLLDTWVALDVTDMPFPEFLEKLFAGAGVTNYVIDPNISGEKVTIRLKDATLRDALTLTLRQLKKPAVYTTENGVFIIKPAP